MKVYIANVNNCEKYVEYAEENRGVYLTRQEAIEAMSELGFEPTTKSRVISRHGVVEREEYRIEEWELPERVCKPVEKNSIMRCSECDYPLGIMSLPAYCAGCGAKVVEQR